jgi:hypothetical protein
MHRRAARILLIPALVLATLHAAGPADYRQRVGIYVWGQLAGTLEQAASDIGIIGAGGVTRVYIGPRASWNPQGNDDLVPLDQKVRRPEYRRFLARFPVVMLTAYDSASFEKYKWGRLTARQLAETRDEFRRFAIELARMPGRKIVSNWEFENDCPADQWLSCREYYQARLDGIQAGRASAKKSGLPGEVLTAFEFTIVPGFEGRQSGLVEVAPQLKGLDFISYSCWWSIRHDADAAKVYKDFEYVVPFLKRWAGEHKVTRGLIIGEFGEYWNEHPTSERMKALVDASLANGAEYLFNWVLYDQPGEKDESGRDASHFGKFDLNRAVTPQGLEFQRWFRQAASGKAASVSKGAQQPAPAR